MLIVVIWILLQTTSFQNWLVKKVTLKLSKDLHTKVSIRHVDFELFNKMLLQGALVFDKRNDTLLYAGTAKVNITDWFFIKENIVLKYVELDDGVINLNRKDSVWNYQFMVDYFSSPKKKKDTSKNVIQLDLKIVELNRFKIWQQDEWAGENMLVSLNKLNLYTDDFDMKNKIMKVNKLSLDHPVFSQYSYKGLRPVLNLPLSPSATNITAFNTELHWNKDDWLFALNDLEVEDGNFVFQKFNERPSLINRFDVKHINFSSINGNIKNIQFIKDTLTADVTLSGKERSGFKIKNFKAAFRFDPHFMELKNLDLVTNKSRLGNYYSMRYESFNKAMGNFVHAVSLESNISKSQLSSDDLAFFAPAVKQWKRNFSIEGNIKGTIDNLTASSMIIQSGKENNFNGSFALRGLPNINETYIDLKSNDLTTSYNELANLVPGLKAVSMPNLSAMGKIRFTGTFTGFTNDFVTYGTLTTSIGTIKTDINMKLPANSLPVYFGKIITTNFQLGKFIRSRQIGNLSFNGTVSGNGFGGNNLDIAVDGFIRQVEFNRYNYQNIIAKGKFKNKLFTGFVSIDDPNLKIDGLLGSINFKPEEPEFNFEADVSKFNLKNLHFTKDNFSLTGKFNLNFSGNNIDNFLGSARIYNATLFKDNQQLSFDSLTVNSFYSDEKKYLTVQTNELEVRVTGNFKILELPDAFQLFLNRYYPAYINKPRRTVSNQDFVFDIKTKNIENYILLLNERLKGFNNSEISGELNLSKNSLDIITNVPGFSYGPTRFLNANFTAIGSFDTLTVTGNIEDIIINDSLHLPATKVVVAASNDISDVIIKTSASKTLTEADLSARIQTLSDGFKLYFNPSSFVINDKKWILEKGGELVLSKKLLMASEIKFVQDKQELIISTEPSAIGSTNDIVVNLKKIIIGDFTPFILKTMRLQGLLTGNVRIADPFKNLMIDFDTQIDQLFFESDSIGILKANGSYFANAGDLLVNAVSDNELYNFTADLAYKAKDSTDNQIKGTLNLSRSNIHIL